MMDVPMTNVSFKADDESPYREDVHIHPEVIHIKAGMSNSPDSRLSAPSLALPNTDLTLDYIETVRR